MKPELLKIFNPLLEKREVISTVSSLDLLERPQDVEDIFKRANLTYYPLHKKDDLEDNLFRKISKNNRTVFGYITSPYGYGKTSVLAYLWQKLEGKGFLSIPPFTFSDYRDIIHALYGWCRFKIASIDTKSLKELEEFYSYLSNKSLEKEAEMISAKDGIAKRDALKAVERMYQQGSLLLTIQEDELVKLIEEVSQVSINAGFKGIVLLLDEIQQFIYPKGQQTMKPLTKLFDFWSKMTVKKLPVAIIMSMPSHTEAGIREKRKDILDRLLEDGIHCNLLNLYNHSTPQILWDNILKQLGGKDYRDIVDKETLYSLGQIAFQENLGDGPRTVTEVFKRIIRYYDKYDSIYTPVQLVDDFIKGEISYDGAKSTLAQVVNSVLSTPDIKKDEEIKALKLLAAFPRGVPEDILKKYNLVSYCNKVVDKLLGRSVQYHLEGYTLKSLLPSEASSNIIDEMIKDFLRHYEEDFRNNASEVIESFSFYIIPKLFETKSAQVLDKWSPFSMSKQDESYFTITEGTFSSEYPSRRIYIDITSNIFLPCAYNIKKDIHYYFVFEFDGKKEFDQSEPGKISIQDDKVVFKINPDYPFGNELPRALMKLKEFVRPKKVTIMFMLLIRKYLEKWEEVSNHRELNSKERTEIKTFLIEPFDKHIVEAIFSNNQYIEGIISTSINGIGTQRLKQLFNTLCKKRWANYTTMINRVGYEKDIQRVQTMLKNTEILLSQKRGRDSIEKEKLEIAKMFGYDSIATFETSIDTIFKHYIKKDKWEGKHGKITLILHPLERLIYNKLDSDGTEKIIKDKRAKSLDDKKVGDYCLDKGYLLQEISSALGLLILRQMVEVDKDSKLIYLKQADVTSKNELEEKFNKQIKELECLKFFVEDKKIQDNIEKIRQNLQQLNIKINNCDDDNDEEREEIDFNLSRTEKDIDRVRVELCDEFKYKVGNLRKDIDNYLYQPTSKINDLDKEVKGNLSFVQNLVGIRTKIKKSFENNHDTLTDIRNEISNFLNDLERINPDVLSELTDRLKEIEKKSIKSIDEQNKLSKDYDGYIEWRHILEYGSNLLTNIHELQMDDLSDRINNEICPEISQMFTLKKLEGVREYKIYKAKFDKIKEEKEVRYNEGQTIFNEESEKYCELLRKLKVPKTIIRTRFDYSDPEKSRKDRITEIYENVNERIKELKNEISELDNEIIKANDFQKIETEEHAQNFKRLKEGYNNLRLELEQSFKVFSKDLIKNHENFKNWTDKIINSPDRIKGIKDVLITKILLPGKPTREEEVILKVFEDSNREDFTRIALKLKKQSNMSLENMFEHLKELFKKNLVNIQIQRRR